MKFNYPQQAATSPNLLTSSLGEVTSHLLYGAWAMVKRQVLDFGDPSEDDTYS